MAKSVKKKDKKRISLKPGITAFEKAAKAYRGNISEIAKLFDVSRATMHAWITTDEQFAEILQSERKRLFDYCLSMAEVVALGILKKNEKGEVVGWEERPDSNMLRYLLSSLGKNEGFGEKTEVEISGGAPIVGIMLPDNKRGKIVEIETND
jgi:transposase-like protein